MFQNGTYNIHVSFSMLPTNEPTEIWVECAACKEMEHMHQKTKEQHA